MNRFVVFSLMLLLLLFVSEGFALWENFPLRANGTVVFWTVAGPLPNKMGLEHGKDCTGYYKDYLVAQGGEQQAMPAEQDLILLEDGKQLAWQTICSDTAGALDYLNLFKVDRAVPGVAYAFCQLNSDRIQEVVFKIRSDDGVRVWLNQDLIHDHHQGRSIMSAQDMIKAELKKGENRLLIKVDQGSGEWGLVAAIVGSNGEPLKGVTSSIGVTSPFKNKFKSAGFAATDMIVNTVDGERQIIEATIISGGLKNVSCRIAKADWSKAVVISLGDLPPGKNRLELPVLVISDSSVAQISLKAKSDRHDVKDVPLVPPRKWTVYLVQHTHTDVGYTRPQDEILPEHLRFIDYALDFCDQTDTYPDDAKFRWTCETSWAVREYLRRRPQEQIERLKKRIAEGRIEVTGMFLNTSEAASEEAVAASLEPIGEIREQGIAVQTAMQDDVNGAAWCLADFLSDIGIKFLTMGINQDRSLLPFDKPTAFWWEAPSGKRILAFRAEHYHTGNRWQIHLGYSEQFKLGMLEYLESLKQRSYPYDRVSVQFSGYKIDNSPPALIECDVVKEWNSRYAWPKLRLATAQEFLQYVERQHGKVLPVYRVAWPDWWTDGFGSAARETGAARQTQMTMQVNESLLAMASLLGAQMPAGTMSRIRAAQDALAFYYEHSFGAAESISDPKCENSMVQWNEKKAFIWDEVKKAGMLREEALGLLQGYVPRSVVPSLAVFNTLNWPRSGLVQVFVDHEILPIDKSFRIVDGVTGEAIPAQLVRHRTEGSYWALWVKDIPPLGYKVYPIVVIDQVRPPSQPPKLESGILENSFYKIQWDAESGSIVSLADKETGQELVDQDAPWKLGQVIYENLPEGRKFNRDAFRRTSLNRVRMTGYSDTPIWKSLQFSAEADGCSEPEGVKGEIRLCETEKRIELHFTIRKLPITTGEAIYVAFPFNLPESKIVYEAQGGLVTPGENQLPGSSSDWQTVQSFISVGNQAGQIVLGSDQIPLVQLGDINLGKWQKVAKVEKPHVYSWVLNNYWFTNFVASQEGEIKWSYYLTSSKDTSSLAATRFSWNSRVPLATRILPAGKGDLTMANLSLLRLDGSGVALVSSKPALDGKGIILYLREVAGKETRLELSTHAPAREVRSLEEVTVLEQPLRLLMDSIPFLPYEVKFIKLEF